METQELRIGNYIDTLNRSGSVHLPNNKPMILGSISFFKVELYEIYKPFGEQLVPPKTDVFDLAPIPITKEWLIKFGFKQYSKLSSFQKRGCKFHIRKNKGFIAYLSIYSDSSKILTRVHYIHQLQNLYYALTVKELTL